MRRPRDRVFVDAVRGREETRDEIDAAASDLRITREQLSLFRQGIIPQARQTTASMLAGYQVNKVDFLNLVRAQLSEFNNDMQQWQIFARVHQSEARLAAAAGRENLYSFTAADAEGRRGKSIVKGNIQ